MINFFSTTREEGREGGGKLPLRPLDSILIRPDLMKVIEIRPRPHSSQPKPCGFNDVHDDYHS